MSQSSDKFQNMSRDEVFASLNEIVERQQTLAARGDALSEQLETKAEDLKAIQQRITEMENRSNLNTSSQGDVEMRHYVDGDRVRWADEGAKKGLLTDTPRTDWQRELRSIVSDRNLARAFVARGGTPKLDAKLQEHMAKAPHAIQRIFADSAGIGAEFIPDILVPDLYTDLLGARRVEALFPTLTMPAATTLLPFVTLGSTPYIGSVPTSDDPAKFTASSDVTAQRTIAAKSFRVRMQADDDALEDSVVMAMPMLRASCVSALVDGVEDAIINGDTAGSGTDAYNLWNPRSRWDTGATLGGTSDHRKHWIGLRHRAFDTSAAVDSSGAQTFAGYMTIRSTLDAPQGVSGDLVCITSAEYLITKMLQFTEVVTVDQFGPAASVITGQLANLAGVPIVISDFMTSDLNDSGLFDNVTTNKTSLLIANTSRFLVGQYRAATVELDREISNGVTNVVATRRVAFGTVDSSTRKNVALGYDLDAS